MVTFFLVHFDEQTNFKRPKLYRFYAVVFSSNWSENGLGPEYLSKMLEEYKPIRSLSSVGPAQLEEHQS